MSVKITNGTKVFRSVKSFDEDSDDAVVLQKFNLSVPSGCLYSLLGSSGCGKSTVVSIIMGLSKLDRGKLEVIRSSNRPIGYMPQETCLYSMFTIFETLYYFGTLFGICNEDGSISKHESLKLRINYLIKLLLLPSEGQIVGTLSGGQKRRLSLAVALVHEPEILLLDEPASGLDPLVRQLIWEHLSTLVRIKGTTVILTTHNVEEAKYSSIVGFMRNGQMLAEDTPANLFAKYGVNSMESLFLELSRQEIYKNVLWHSSLSKQSLTSPEEGGTVKQEVILKGSMRRISALIGKNFKCTFRDIWMLLFIIAIPAVCMLCACFSVKYDAHKIALGVVNDEVNGIVGSRISCKSNNTLKDFCRTEQLSCSFLETLEGDTIDLGNYPTVDSAVEAVENGNIWGYLYFAENYTAALTNRFLMGSSSYYDEGLSGEKEWNDSKIYVRLDQTNHLIYGTIMETLYTAFENSSKLLLKHCGHDERIAEFPLQYDDPIFGTRDIISFTYFGPGFTIELIYIFSLATSFRFITERRDGTLERCIAGGAKYWEILVSYSISQSSVLLFQCILVLSALYIGSSVITYLSNLPLILILCFLQGFSGFSLGLFSAMFFTDEFQAAIALLAFVLPNAVVSGLLWMFEGLPQILQTISPYLPMTLSGEAMRSMMIRGWSIDHPNVWPGFVVTLGYIFLFSFLIFVLIGKQLRR